VKKQLKNSEKFKKVNLKILGEIVRCVGGVSIMVDIVIHEYVVN